MSEYQLSFFVEETIKTGKDIGDALSSVITALASSFPDVPSILNARCIPGEDPLVMIPIPIGLQKEREAEIHSFLDRQLAVNGLRIKKR